MSRMNVERVVAGGLVTGCLIVVSDFVLYGVVIEDSFVAALASLALPPPDATADILLSGLGLLLGIGAVWLYAAILPRFGSGPGTAIIAGLATWVFVCLLPDARAMALGVLPPTLIVVAAVWDLVELPVATLVGAWLYRDAPARAAKRPGADPRAPYPAGG